MKKTLSLFLSFLIINVLICIPVNATQSKIENFNKNYSLSGNHAYDIASVAEVQEGRTGASFGYSEHWCADFVSDCARSAGIFESRLKHIMYWCLENPLLLAGLIA